MSALRRHQLGEWTTTTPDGERLLICKGWTLVGAARKRAIMGRWYVTTMDRTRRVGNPDGYDLLRDVRQHLAAVEIDRANGADVSWLGVTA